MTALILKKTIPAQIINEGATYGPLRLTEFIESPVDHGKLYFRAELSDGQPLPKGLICTTEGILNGIPAAGTHGSYTVIITVVNDEAEELVTEFEFTINPRMAMGDEGERFNKLKAEIWEALGKNLPAPEMQDILNRPITAVEIYYLLQRFATLTIWDAYNLDYSNEKIILNLEGMSKHYNIYDRGCCLVGAPKELFSHERTLEDTLQTAKVMAREVYRRDWIIEFAGFDKMVRAAWIEIQILAERYGKELKVLYFSPTSEDLKIVQKEMKSQRNAPTSGI
jgi:hypothetical protein